MEITSSFNNPSELNKNDFLSNLNNDCLLHAFSYLDKLSLDNMDCINQRIRQVSSHSSLKQI
ncbi:hypothetical protein PFISCL1PPCAC_17664, partial [Pristionchus fissidentatus]